jgi:hypothetical protein
MNEAKQELINGAAIVATVMTASKPNLPTETELPQSWELNMMWQQAGQEAQ